MNRILATGFLALALAIPSTAQELGLATPAGQPVSTAALGGRVVVLMFSAVHDPQCRDEFKALDALTDRYQGKPVSIYWVAINSAAEAPADRLARPCGVSSSVPVLRLSDVNGLKRLTGKTPSLPTTVVLNKQGQPFGQPRAGFNPNSDFVNDIAGMIDSLLAQK
jgi:thiol-disulfide isomerase/thioredoxin